MPDSDDPAASPFDQHLGTEFLETEADHATARLQVADHHLQPFGVVHGGVYCALAESVTARATALSVFGDGMIALGQANETSFLRPPMGEVLEADARRRHAGRTTWVWDVEITDSERRLCAISRVTIAIRPIPD